MPQPPASPGAGAPSRATPGRIAALRAAVLGELLADRAAVRALLAACLVIAAAGLDPHVLDPGSPRVRAALDVDPSLDSLVAVAAVAQAALLLAGGAIADLWRSVALVRAALVGLVIAAVGAVLAGDSLLLVGVRVLGWACDGILIPYATATVAQLYRGTTRGTAIGLLLASYGAATFVAPILVGIAGTTGPAIVASAACLVVALLALRHAVPLLPALPGARPNQRLTIITTAIWALGVIIVVGGLLQFEVPYLVAGAVLIVAALLVRRVLRAPREEGVRARAAGAALMAGLVIGVSQATAMTVLPAFFHIVQGVDTLVASVMILPFVAGLVVAGPAAGWLLGRYSPRRLILAGVWSIGLADVAFAVLVGHSTSYLTLVVPFLLVGVGFMVSTAVRTAIIFASTPRRMAGTAAALNESSLGVGTRFGITLVVLLQGGLLGNVDDVEWIRVALAGGALFGIVGGMIVFLVLGRHDPLRAMWDLSDERQGADGTVAGDLATGRGSG